VGGEEQKKKPHFTGLHSDMHIWAPSFWTLRILSILLWGPSGTFVKEEGLP